MDLQATLDTQQAASSPIGPAPVTSTTRGRQTARLAIRLICSQALATTLVGSSSTPVRVSLGSTLTT